MAAKISAPGHGGGKRGRLDVTADPNVIPFIDVMLVLLIIFMIAAPIASVDIQVDLPDSKIIPSQRPPKPTWVSLQDDGEGHLQVFVMEQLVAHGQVGWEDVGVRTKETWQRNTPSVDFHDCLTIALDAGDDSTAARRARVFCRIYVRADSGTRYKNVMRVMNRLQDVGFTKIALVAEDRR
jgi:biopolymer transport protein ExbD